MSLYLEDAKKLFNEASYRLASAVSDRKQSEFMVNKAPTDDNKKWLQLDKEKETIMYAVYAELEELVEVAKKQEEMMNTES